MTIKPGDVITNSAGRVFEIKRIEISDSPITGEWTTYVVVEENYEEVRIDFEVLRAGIQKGTMTVV